MVNNPRHPHTCVITRVEKNPDPMVDGEQETIIYIGVCRSYPYNLVSDRGEVITSTRRLSVPVTQQEWESMVVPQVGDELVVTRPAYSESGRILDVQDNNLGTTILWRKNT